MENSSKNYEILDQFTSNAIQIGTFNVFMNITCDLTMIGPNQTLNLSWILYGVSYSHLSDPKCQNCVGFYKVAVDTCSKIDIVPPSAYAKVGGNQPCPGRMVVKTPSEPGMYTIRFLFNFFKKAQLHRNCQVFGELENQMQQLRINSFYEKRAVINEIQTFASRKPEIWAKAQKSTFSWLKLVLLRTIQEPVDINTMKSTAKYSERLLSQAQKNLQLGLETKKYQTRISRIISPFNNEAFMRVLVAALSSNSQVTNHLASITFMFPVNEDIEKEGKHEKNQNSRCLANDESLFRLGPDYFPALANNYLYDSSVCGYHDVIDDIVLDHEALCQSVEQVMSDVSTVCVPLYESIIVRAVEGMIGETKEPTLKNVLNKIMLIDLCRNHIQSIIRAFIETDRRTGKRWKKQNQEEKQEQEAVTAEMVDLVVHDGQEPTGGLAPITLQHIAVRKWIHIKLQKKITKMLKSRYARLLNGNLPLLKRAWGYCRCHTEPTKEDAFPYDVKIDTTKSPLYFLNEKGKSEDSNQVNDDQVDANLNMMAAKKRE